MNRHIHAAIVKSFALGIVLGGGCGEDGRVARVAEQAAQRQADQNEQMARVTREAAEGSKRLIEADTQARRELADLHKSLQAEQAAINRNRDDLEKERREIAQQRVHESILAPILANLGPLVVCGLVLVFCCLLISRTRGDRGDDVSEILIDELTSTRPVLLPPPAAAARLERDGPRATAISDGSDQGTETPDVE